MNTGTQPRIQVILLRGLPGVGKTSLARGLSKKLRYPLLCKDDIRDHLVLLDAKVNQTLAAHGVNDHIDSNLTCYDVLCTLMLTQMRCGLSIIVESPMGRRDLYDRFCDLAASCGAIPLTVDCRMQREDWKQRLEHRRLEGKEPPHKPHDAKEILTHYGDGINYELDRGPSLILDMNPSIDGLVYTVMQWLANFTRQPEL